MRIYIGKEPSIAQQQPRRCKYISKYDPTYQCPRDAISNSDYCIFNDKDYWRNDPEHVRDEFLNLVEDAIKKKKPLVCIGFNIPSFSIGDLRKRGIEEIKFNSQSIFRGSHFSWISRFLKSHLQWISKLLYGNLQWISNVLQNKI